MSESEPSAPRLPLVSVLGWCAVLFVLVGMTQVIRHSLSPLAPGSATSAALENIRLAEAQQQAAQTAALQDLQTQVAALHSELSTAHPQETAAPEVLAALKDQDAKLVALSQHLDALDANMKKQPAATAPGGASAAARLLMTLQGKLLRGEPYRDELEQLAPLPALAHDAQAIADLRAEAGGALSEFALRNAFDVALETAGQGKTGEDSNPTLQKINTHLNGLVTIKPRVTNTAPDAYQKLRELPPDAPIAELVSEVNLLPDDARVPFEDWLNAVAARDKALAGVTVLQTRLMPLAS